MKNKSSMYVIDLLFTDGKRTKYVVTRNGFRDVKSEARDIKDSWNHDNRQPPIQDFSVKELNNEDSKRKQDSDNPRHSPKPQVRKHYLESEEEYS